MEADFSGYATRSNMKCSDGRVILAHAFKDNDGQKVPLVWQHLHQDPSQVLGHAILENREDGVYAYGFFNNSDNGQIVKGMVQHGDVNSLSIYANQLVQRGENVHHGQIKEVSIVLAGANPGATIENVALAHGATFEEVENEAIIHSGEVLELELEDVQTEGDTVATATEEAKEEKTLEEIYESMTDEQKKFVDLIAANANKDSDDDSDDSEDSDSEEEDEEEEKIQHSDLSHQEETPMTRNVFDQNEEKPVAGATLTHSQIQTIMQDAKTRFGGSVKASFLAHAEEYGITNIEILFPDAKKLTSTPEFVKRRTEWVADVMDNVKPVPFARIKSVFADITADDARAKGYITGTLKKEEVIELLKRVTTPTTVYKKQKLDRDDVIDITDLDVIAWLKAEMRLMIDEEVARAILLGDGRSPSDDDKIKDPASQSDGAGIRSIANDHEFYAHQVQLEANVSTKTILEQMIRARSSYRGSGSPAFYTTDTFIADALLLEDNIGRRLYTSVADVAAALRVDRLVAVEVMEAYPEILGIMVNLKDYTVGTDKGGELNFFDDFDIDWNQYKYLIETRLSGALNKPKAAVVVRRTQGTAATPVSPSFDGEENEITIPTTTGIDYQIDGVTVTGTVTITATTEVTAIAQTDYYIPNNTVKSWTFVYTG